MKINFEAVEIYADIAKKHFLKLDVREQFADLIYKNATGIKAHELALKIYHSQGETEFSEEECFLIRQYANSFCTPGFIDAVNALFEASGSHP